MEESINLFRDRKQFNLKPIQLKRDFSVVLEYAKLGLIEHLVAALWSSENFAFSICSQKVVQSVP